MTAQIAGPSIFALELVGLLVVAAIVITAVDLLRQPGWAWKQAKESKAAYLVLVLLLPVIGIVMYVLSARSKVVAISTAGRAASLPFEHFGQETAQPQRQDGLPAGTIAAPAQFAAVPAGGDGDQVRMVQTNPPPRIEPMEPASTFFSAGGTATKTLRPSITLARPYRPKQRTSLEETAPAPTVPAGWKADPTGRHQFRYWDGFQWTENVADAGEQSRDAVSS
jgi:hypothetical protein